MSDQTPTPPTPEAAPAATPAAAPPEPPKATPSAAKGKAPAEPPKPAEPAQEPPKAEEKPKPKADDWAKLSAAEKRQRAERDKLDARAKELAAQEKALEAQRERAALIDRAKAGDWEAREKLLAETGVTYDELTKRKLSGGKVDKAETALERVERLEKELQERDAKAQRELEEGTVRHATETFVQHVTKEAAEQYPILAGEVVERPDWVQTVIREAINESRRTGSSITYAEAAQRLEQHLRDETERRYARLRPAQPPTPPPAAEEAPTTSTETRPRDQAGRFAGGGGPRRLTNEVSAERSSSALPRPERARQMTQRERDIEERERLKRAAAALPSRR